MTVVTVDVHERMSGIPELLRHLGLTVEVRSIARGDYILGPETVVERKTVRDLHASIASGRLWRQMMRVRQAGRWPVLLIEGESLFRGGVSSNAIRGACLAISDLGITIIRSEDAEDSAAWLARLAQRRSHGGIRTRAPDAGRHPSVVVPPAQAALACAPNVSLVTARRVLASYATLHSVATATATELERLHGVGPQRARAIVSLIHNRWDADPTL